MRAAAKLKNVACPEAVRIRETAVLNLARSDLDRRGAARASRQRLPRPSPDVQRPSQRDRLTRRGHLPSHLLLGGHVVRHDRRDPRAAVVHIGDADHEPDSRAAMTVSQNKESIFASKSSD